MDDGENKYLDLDNLVNVITLDHSITYIGIGTCCYRSWSLQDDQQYLYMIRQAKEMDETLHINLILIDPGFRSENPPVCVTETRAICDHQLINVYHTDNLIDIYIFSESVMYLPEYISIPTQGRDISSFLIYFNQLCGQPDRVLIVHDFSGQEIDILALYVDQLINKKQIIYDLSCRCGIGCMMDFRHIYCTLIHNNHISVFNPFGIAYDQFYNQYINASSESIRKQILACANYHKNLLMTLYFHNFRRGKLWQQSKISDRDLSINKRVIKINEIKLLDHLHGTNLLQLYNHDDAENFLILMGNLFMIKCHEIGEIYHVDSYQMIGIILSIKEPHLWTDPMIQYLSILTIDQKIEK